MQRVTIFFVFIWSETEQQSEIRDRPYQQGKVPLGPHKLTDLEVDDRQKELLMVAAANLIHGTNPIVWETAEIRERSSQCVSFEIGFVLRTMEESYRKMLDIYNTTVQFGIRNNNAGRIHYLQRVEKLYWEVIHLSNMIHEIERKYKMDTFYNASGLYENGKLVTTTKASTVVGTRTPSPTPKLTTSWWYPLEYGFKPGDYYW